MTVYHYTGNPTIEEITVYSKSRYIGNHGNIGNHSNIGNRGNIGNRHIVGITVCWKSTWKIDLSQTQNRTYSQGQKSNCKKLDVLGCALTYLTRLNRQTRCGMYSAADMNI